MMNRVITCIAASLLASPVIAADALVLLAQADEVACTMDYTPVCGADGKTCPAILEESVATHVLASGTRSAVRQDAPRLALPPLAVPRIPTESPR